MASFRSLLLFLAFSCVLLSCAAAVPATRSLHHSFQEAVGVVQIKDSELGNIEGKMDVETTVDYPGTGANNHHDPKTPGRA